MQIIAHLIIGVSYSHNSHQYIYCKLVWVSHISITVSLIPPMNYLFIGKEHLATIKKTLFFLGIQPLTHRKYTAPLYIWPAKRFGRPLMQSYDLKYRSCGMVHQGISRRVLRGSYVRPWSMNLLFCRREFGLVVSVVVPLMMAVLPYARGRGLDSRSRLGAIVHTCDCHPHVITVDSNYSLESLILKKSGPLSARSRPPALYTRWRALRCSDFFRMGILPQMKTASGNDQDLT
jgi:hypothetical protein